MTIWYIYSGFGIMYQEKSGNPGIGRCIFRKMFVARKTLLPDRAKFRRLENIFENSLK
jgi:hypothetical protein